MRLIDADALGIGLCNPDVFMDRAYAAGWNGVVRLLQSAPTITPESQVRHGRWIFDGDDEYASHYHCSRCNTGIDLCNEIHSEPTPNYCPYCGAKMDLEE